MPGDLLLPAGVLLAAGAVILLIQRSRSRGIEPGEQGGERVPEPGEVITRPGIKVSAHFSSSEFICPADGTVRVDRRLVLLLESLRMMAGNRPVVIHHGGGYRTPAYNQQVGGVPNSYHMRGMAADLHVQGLPLARLYVLAYNTWYCDRWGGVGLYPWGVHVDIGEPGRLWDER